MKKTAFKKMVLMAGLMFTVILAKSNTTPSTTSLTNETEKTIHDFFKFPHVLIPRLVEKGQTNKIEVLFTTDINGNVNFVLAKTKDLLLKKEIEKQFTNLHLKKIKQDVVHSVVLNFRTA